MQILAEDLSTPSVMLLTTASAIIVAIINVIFQWYLDRRSYKQRIKYETRFQTMHEKQSAAIQELYQKLDYARQRLQEYIELTIETFQTINDTERRSFDAYRQVLAHFERYQLLFPKSVANRIDDILILIWQTHVQFRKCNRQEAAKTLPERSQSYIEVSMQEMDRAIKPRIHELGMTFRQMMSVEEEK